MPNQLARQSVYKPSRTEVGVARLLRTTGAPQLIAQFQNFSLFEHLSSSDIIHISGRSHRRTFLVREFIFRQGDQVKDITMVMSGTVKIIQCSHSGEIVILRLKTRGDIVSCFEIDRMEVHTCAAQTLETVTVISWERKEFKLLMDRYPQLGCNIAKILLARLRDIEQRFREVSTESVPFRIATFIIRLVTTRGGSAKDGVEINLSRTELAQLTGTTVFTVSRLISKWARRGCLHAKRGGIVVYKPNELLQE